MKIAIEIDCGVTECDYCDYKQVNACIIFGHTLTKSRQVHMGRGLYKQAFLRHSECLSAEALAKKEE